ncbi:tyrosine-protein phosphatase [Flammeovirga sp. SubArs3]|uniref:tyrosine-protein phosphatase n=1 Tax=Flammeovirga sp. SubArs3 TaxID=2995316 RepID=UPI00248BB70E|nr:tyrosine-protein phosphatase [Flammeovirga sp. SubArs3]
MKKLVILISTLIMMSCNEHVQKDTPERTLFEEIYVQRTDDGNYKFENFGDKEWDIYHRNIKVGRLVDHFDLDFHPSHRGIFLAISEQDSVWVSERNLSINGAPNFRDIGGIYTKDNHQVKWGAIYRSDDFSEIDKYGWEKLSELNVKSKVDFRSLQEKEENPDKFVERLNGNEFNLIIDPGNMDEFKTMIMDKNTTQQDIDNLVLEMNRLFVKKWAHRYKEYFNILINTEEPIVFHCTAGKDRTGLCSALTLYALGVDLETIYDEYELSNHYRHGKNESLIKKISFLGVQPEIMRQLLGVDRTWLQAGFDQIIKDYGSIDQYFENVLELSQADISVLRSKYLY